MIKTFCDWCIETDNTYLLELWDCKLNNIIPNEIGFASSRKIYFKCPRGIHESELYTINNITGPKHQIVNCRKCHSFGQWCLDNNQQELLDRWDYELNSEDPFRVSYGSGKKYYFKCPFNNPLHPSELKMLSNVVKQEGSRKCLGCESFGQWCIDNVDSDFLTKYWSDKNTINPFTIAFRHSLHKVWIKCQKKDYHEDYDIYPYNFVKGERCPYCSSKRVNYYDSLGYRFIENGNYWSEKNNISPFEIMPYSNKEYWFHCDIHGDYKAKACDFTNNEGICIKCTKEDSISQYQKKVQNYIKHLGYECLHEGDCNLTPVNPLTNYKLFYDNEIPKLNLIIEVNGNQHYEITLFAKQNAVAHGTTPEQELNYQRYKDKYKKDYALKHGYEFLEIPYYTVNNNEKYKELIDNKIKEIQLKTGSLTTAGDVEQSAS